MPKATDAEIAEQARIVHRVQTEFDKTWELYRVDSQRLEDAQKLLAEILGRV